MSPDKWHLNAGLSHKEEGSATKTLEKYDDYIPGVTYDYREISFLEWFMSNPYKLGFYFLLGVCMMMLYLR